MSIIHLPLLIKKCIIWHIFWARSIHGEYRDAAFLRLLLNALFKFFLDICPAIIIKKWTFWWSLQVVYSGAILEVCMRKLVFYPELVGFIEEEKDKFPTIKVQYAYNSPPKLIMLDDDRKVKETIRWAYCLISLLI